MSAWSVPWMHVAFENTAAVASGVESAYTALKRRGKLPRGSEDVTIVAFAGDGGTYDIGLQALSGALERGHRFIFVCYDNQAYMNTGIQRSGATPFGAATTTTPAGAASLGKLQQRKDMTAIAAAHHVPYVAQAAGGPHWQDLSMKAARAAKADGPAFLNVLTDCPLGWGHEPREAFNVQRAALDTCFWPLYEVVDGSYRLTYEPEPKLPIDAWLHGQARFAHVDDELRDEIQRRVDADWEELRARCAR
jgi:pyruvate ferredoxin oxidoreductase beta subunit